MDTLPYVVTNILIPLVFATLVSFRIHPLILKVALMKRLTDMPNSRKLHHKPIPVIGGLVVYLSMLVGLALVSLYHHGDGLLIVAVSTSLMLFLGLLDDIVSLSPSFRLCVEMLCLLFVIGHSGESIDSLDGFCGLTHLSSAIAIPLTVFSGLGIINGINLIDGIDGLSSGLCICASLCFGIMFAMAGNPVMASIAFLCVGALTPFFFHNVFGKKYKMFIGDCGSMMLGMLMTIFCIRTIHVDGAVAQHLPGISTIAFCLSVLSIPVFDTLRVMACRILRRRSPLKPDKTHLHHLFIALGLSHFLTTTIICSLNMICVVAWGLAFLLGASGNLQLAVVVAIGLLNTVGMALCLTRLGRYAKARNQVQEMTTHPKCLKSEAV